MLTAKEARQQSKIFSEADRNMAATFKVLSDVNRYRIFRLLAIQPELTVSDIARVLNISLPLTSQHLKVLVHANLLQKERTGKRIYPKLTRTNLFVQAAILSMQHALKFTR